MQTAALDTDTERAAKLFIRCISRLYDMAVLLQGPHQRFLPTTLAMADMAFDVLLETGINISPLPIWLDEWEHPESYSNPALLKNIANEGVLP